MVRRVVRRPSCETHARAGGGGARYRFFFPCYCRHIAARASLTPHPFTTLPAEPFVKDSYTAQRFLAEERKGKVVLELDRQLEVKRAREAGERQREADFQDSMIHTLAASVQRDEAAQRVRVAQRRVVNEGLARQLEDVEYRKMVEMEAREQEAALMLDAAKRAAAAADATAARKKEMQRAQARETADANRAVSERDAVRKAREREADEDLRRYQLSKAAREEEEDRRRKEEKREKELQQAKMIAEQKRAMDNSAAEDEVKARTHEERRILADRARAAEEARRKEVMKKEVQDALDLQLQLKETRKVVEAERERELQAWQTRAAAEAIAKEAERLEAKRLAGRDAMAFLVSQKDERIALRDYEKTKKPMEEARQLALVAAAERIVLERFRDGVKARMESDHLPETFVKTVRNLKQRTQ